MLISVLLTAALVAEDWKPYEQVRSDAQMLLHHQVRRVILKGDHFSYPGKHPRGQVITNQASIKEILGALSKAEYSLNVIVYSTDGGYGDSIDFYYNERGKVKEKSFVIDTYFLRHVMGQSVLDMVLKYSIVKPSKKETD